VDDTSCGSVVEDGLAGRLGGLANGVRDFVRLAQADADRAGAISNGDDRVETEPAATLDDLGDAIDMDQPIDELGLEPTLTSIRPIRPIRPLTPFAIQCSTSSNPVRGAECRALELQTCFARPIR
jgi:hypothetical protein